MVDNKNLVQYILDQSRIAERDEHGNVQASIVLGDIRLTNNNINTTHITPEAREAQVEVAKQNVEAMRARYENPVRIVMRYGLGFFALFMLFMGGMVVLTKVLVLNPILTGVVLILGAIVVVPSLGIIFTKFVGKILADVMSGVVGGK